MLQIQFSGNFDEVSYSTLSTTRDLRFKIFLHLGFDTVIDNSIRDTPPKQIYLSSLMRYLLIAEFCGRCFDTLVQSDFQWESMFLL